MTIESKPWKSALEEVKFQHLARAKGRIEHAQKRRVVKLKVKGACSVELIQYGVDETAEGENGPPVGAIKIKLKIVHGA